jgi:N-dimethylarginine dimethylaminohydrolase
MIKPHVQNEYSLIKKVVLGIADNFGGCPTIEDAYDPKSKENILRKTFPIESKLIHELSAFETVLKKYNVHVIRPENIFNCNQVFARDVGFVIENKLFLSNMINKRSLEIQGLELVLKQINSNSIYDLPSDICVEGGDVIVAENYLFIGFSNSEDFSRYEVARTNTNAINYFQTLFPDKKVVGFELNKSDTNPYVNCLHLDCCFQPLGLGHVLVCPAGFKNPHDLNVISSI